MGFFKHLFSGKSQSPEVEQQQSAHKQFEVFKYDGMRAQRMGQADFAIKCYTEALNLEPDFETMGYLASLYIQRGRLPEARELLEKQIKAEPSYTESYLTLANVCYMQEDYTAMAEAAQKVIAIEAGNATAHYLLAKADDGMNNPLMSIAHLTQAIVLKDDYIEARLLRAEALLKMGQLHEADEDIQMVLQSDAENESALLLRGRAKQMEGNDTAAEEDYLHLIALNPFNEQAYLALGALYINAKAYDKAIALFNEAIEVNPQFANAYHERGRAKLLSGNKEGAAADMKSALELNPLEVERLNGAFSNQEQESPRINILGI